jgi:uncharacterized lipoprotein
MTQRFITGMALLAATVLLSSCGSISCGNGHSYADSVSRPPLRVPPGVTVPVPDAAYAVPGASTSTKPAAAPCMIEPPQVVPSGASAAAAAKAASPAPSAGTKNPAPAVAPPPPMK